MATENKPPTSTEAAPAIPKSKPKKGEEILQRLLQMDVVLGQKGFPRITRWWLRAIAKFYRRGKKQFVIRAGRRAGKSSTLCTLAIVEALYGKHNVAPGDLAVVAIVSVSRDEANQRLRNIKAKLDALGIKYHPIEGGIELDDKVVGFKVFAGSVGGVSGFSCIFAFCDEVAKWKDSDSGVNPATEVLASLRPTMAGQDNAKIVLSSSPMGKLDAHAVAFDLGDTKFQVTESAPTWVARPQLTEADCHELEPDPDIFSREYGVIPFDGSTSSLFTEPQLLLCTRKGVKDIPREVGVEYFAAQDPASRRNEWTLAIARLRKFSSGIHLVQIVACKSWRAPRGGVLDNDDTLFAISEVLKSYGIKRLWSDQWSFDSLKVLAQRHGIDLREEPATQSNRVQQFESLRRRISDRTVEFPDDPIVRADLCGVRKWISRNGAFSIELERVGGRHADHASSVALVVEKAEAGIKKDRKHGARCPTPQVGFGGEYAPIVPTTGDRMPLDGGGGLHVRAGKKLERQDLTPGQKAMVDAGWMKPPKP
jgi:hypothetical protein